MYEIRKSEKIIKKASYVTQFYLKFDVYDMKHVLKYIVYYIIPKIKLEQTVVFIIVLLILCHQLVVSCRNEHEKIRKF